MGEISFPDFDGRIRKSRSAPAPDSNMKSEEPAAVAEAEVSEEAVQQPQEVEMTN